MLSGPASHSSRGYSYTIYTFLKNSALFYVFFVFDDFYFRFIVIKSIFISYFYCIELFISSVVGIEKQAIFDAFVSKKISCASRSVVYKINFRVAKESPPSKEGGDSIYSVKYFLPLIEYYVARETGFLPSSAIFDS